MVRFQANKKDFYFYAMLDCCRDQIRLNLFDEIQVKYQEMQGIKNEADKEEQKATKIDSNGQKGRGANNTDVILNDSKPTNYIVSFGCQPTQGVNEKSNFVDSFKDMLMKGMQIDGQVIFPKHLELLTDEQQLGRKRDAAISTC